MIGKLKHSFLFIKYENLECIFPLLTLYQNERGSVPMWNSSLNQGHSKQRTNCGIEKREFLISNLNIFCVCLYSACINKRFMYIFLGGYFDIEMFVPDMLQAVFTPLLVGKTFHGVIEAPSRGTCQCSALIRHIHKTFRLSYVTRPSPIWLVTLHFS